MKLIKQSSCMLFIGFLLLVNGCAGMVFGGHKVIGGMFYADTAANEDVTANPVGSKTGEACAKSIMGWVTTGNASVQEAAKNGGIKKITAVDNKFSNILGVIATYCVVVVGE